MRFAVLVKGAEDTDRGYQPPADELAAMSKFNERLLDEGRLVYAEGLTPSAEGCRVVFEGDGETRVVDGPFAETKELVAGFWVLTGESLEDVVALMKQTPNEAMREGVVEIRPISG